MKLIKISNKNIYLINDVMDMIHEEWGYNFSSTKEEKLAKLQKLIEKGENLPQVYLLKNNDENIGTFSIVERELKGSDLSPWLACVVINKKYRGLGYGNILLKHIKQVIEDNFNTIYLTTDMIGFYEKIGFKLKQIIDNNGKNNRLYYKTTN